MNKPTAGQKLYRLNIGNAARHRPQVLTEVIVTKVGRKYFTVAEEGRPSHLDVEFCLHNWSEKTEYCQDYRLYLSREEFEQEKEVSEICRQIYKAFEYGTNHAKVSLPQLRVIAEILTGSARCE